jgi:hypothetical protein
VKVFIERAETEKIDEKNQYAERAETEEHYVESQNAGNVALATQTIKNKTDELVASSRSSTCRSRKLTTTTLNTSIIIISKNKPAESKKIAVEFAINKQV